MPFSRRLALWGPVVVWAGLIFGLSSIPALSTGLGTWDEILRKCAHVTEYAVFGFLLLRAIGRALPALAIGILYAATDELHQHFVQGRHPSPFDVAFDACGLALGLLLYVSVESKRGRTEEDLRRSPAGRRPGTARRPPRGAAAAEQPTRSH